MRRRKQEDGATLREIEEIYRDRFPAFQRTATAMTGDPETGYDVVQDAFANALRRRAEFRREGSLEGWLWRIVVNEARAKRRRAAAAARLTPGAGEVSPNGGHPMHEGAAARDALAVLPERQRLVVFLRYFADLDHRSIAEALDVRPGTVGATLNAAHAALRRRLEEVRS